MPRVQPGAGEGIEGDQVDGERVAAVDEREGAVARHLLPGGGELVGPYAEGEHGVEVAVVDVAGTLGAVVAAVEVAQVAAQAHALGQRAGIDQANELLAVDVLKLGVVVADAGLRGNGITAATEVQVATAGGTETHVVAARRVAQVGLGQAAGVEGEASKVLTGEQAALEGGRQQAGVVVHHHWQDRLQGTHAQGALGHTHLASQAQLAVVVDRFMAVRAKRQQAGVAAIAAGVELDTQLAHGVDTKTDRAVGEAGLELGGEALAPFLGLGLRCVALAEVAVDVVIAQLQPCMAVADEVRHRRQRQGEGSQPGG
ncbi:hypothetical protein D3C81_1040530 [compost metagenome]